MAEDRLGLGGLDAYSVLGVHHDAEHTDITAAYRSLARVYHPDVAGDAGTARMSRINAAFDRLRDPRRRASYDRELGLNPGRPLARRPPPPRPAPPRPTVPRQDGTPRKAPGWTPGRDGAGGAGPPPGRPSGTVLRFGRHLGWSIGEIARVDPGYLEWLEHRREGAALLDEIDETLVRVGFRSTRKRPPLRSRTTQRHRLHRS